MTVEMKLTRPMKEHITRTGKFFGGFVPRGMADAILHWTQLAPERDQSTFIREAAREKLRREGIEFNDTHNTTPAGA